MPNPLSQLALNTSKQPQKTPQATPPVPEEYEGDNNPYRGTEAHGVERTVDPAPIAGWESTRPGIDYAPAEKDQDPVPVKIVQEHGRELRKWRSHTTIITTGDGSKQFVGRNEARTSIYIRNMDDVESVFISPDPINGTYMAFELEGNDSVTINTQDEVHIFTAAAGNVRVNAIETYSVEL